MALGILPTLDTHRGIVSSVFSCDTITLHYVALGAIIVLVKLILICKGDY